MSEVRCDTCRLWEVDSMLKVQGVCHLGPVTSIASTQKSDYWCREHEPMENQE